MVQQTGAALGRRAKRAEIKELGGTKKTRRRGERGGTESKYKKQLDSNTWHELLLRVICGLEGRSGSWFARSQNQVRCLETDRGKAHQESCTI